MLNIVNLIFNRYGIWQIINHKYLTNALISNNSYTNLLKMFKTTIPHPQMPATTDLNL